MIIPHFDKYPLITQKFYDYALFKQIVLLMLDKEHSTLEGIQKIVNLKASLNLGLSEDLKQAFPRTILVKRSELLKNREGYKNLSSDWVAGFATGESNFFIAVQKSKTKSGLSVGLRFSIGQHSRDFLLLENLVNFFGCGYVFKYEKRSVCEFIVTRTDHIINYIIPFFEEHPIGGSKQFNYIDFKNAASIIKDKEHLNPDGKGLKQILELKSNISIVINNHSKSGKEEI